MKTATLKEIKDELKHSSQDELIAYCLRMVKFKKDNKELLTYMMFEADNDHLYIQETKEDVDLAFSEVNKTNMWAAKKQVRKILSRLKKNIRYAQKKEVEIELLMHFCDRLYNFGPLVERNKIMQNTLETQLRMTRKAISTLHPDLQRDYENQLEIFE